MSENTDTDPAENAGQENGNGDGAAGQNEGNRQENAGQPNGGQADTQNRDGGEGGGEGSSADKANADPFAAVDDGTREWMGKRGIKDIESLAKTALEQEKLLGNAVRVPGKDASDEEKEAYLNKLGRPEQPDGYEFEPPKDLPEDLPYDGERAKEFKEVAHKNGLTAAQAQAVHDWAVKNAVTDHTTSSEKVQERNTEIAKGETEKLTKLWGPMDGDQFKTELSFADKALLEGGGEDVVAEFKRVGLIGPDDNNVIMSAPIAQMMAKLGKAIYKEDDVLRGRPDRMDNPFSEGDNHNVTAQMKMIKEDRDQAMQFIAAAGKKPEDFGLKTKTK